MVRTFIQLMLTGLILCGIQMIKIQITAGTYSGLLKAWTAPDVDFYDDDSVTPELLAVNSCCCGSNMAPACLNINISEGTRVQ